MADRPILFSAPMVRAILGGRKTQTRRLMPNHDAIVRHAESFAPIISGRRVYDYAGEEVLSEARFAVGDRLWVKETWHAEASYDDTKPSEIPSDACNVLYSVDQSWSDSDPMNRAGKTRVSIFMPRWASRLTLTVTDVRVQRLQDCSAEDADAEGFGGEYPHVVMPHLFPDAEQAGRLSLPECYGVLWDSINGPGAWESNPWVVAVSFEVQKGNIDG